MMTYCINGFDSMNLKIGRVRISAYIVALSIVCGVRSHCTAHETNLTLSIVPETRHLRQGDAVLIKVVAQNRSDKDISIPLLSRGYNSLVLMLEAKPFAAAFLEAREDGDGDACVDVTPEIVLKPNQAFVAYDRLFRFTDGDFVFRKSGEYKLYAVLRRGEKELAKSEEFSMFVNVRSDKLQSLIVAESDLLRQAFLMQGPRLEAPGLGRRRDPRSHSEKIGALDKLNADIIREYGNLWRDLTWRTDLLRIKYGTEDEQVAARKRLDELRTSRNMNEVAKEVLALQLAGIALERGDWQAARKEVRELPDSSEKRNLTREIDRQREKAAPRNPNL